MADSIGCMKRNRGQIRSSRRWLGCSKPRGNTFSWGRWRPEVKCQRDWLRTPVGHRGVATKLAGAVTMGLWDRKARPILAASSAHHSAHSHGQQIIVKRNSIDREENRRSQYTEEQYSQITKHSRKTHTMKEGANSTNRRTNNQRNR